MINVMIVDDSPAMRSVLKKIVAISMDKVNLCIEAANGLEAMEELKQNRMDVIISGINMPEMTGLGLLQALSQAPLYQNIPVIIVSADGSPEQIKEALKIGARGFIRKPFFPEEIRKILHDVIGAQNGEECFDDQRDPDGGDF